MSEPLKKNVATSAEIADRAHKAAEDLTGTCQGLGTYLALTEEEWLEDDQDFCDVLDTQTLECHGCGWWDEASSVDLERGDCDDCREDEPDEEDDEPEDGA